MKLKNTFKYLAGFSAGLVLSATMVHADCDTRERSTLSLNIRASEQALIRNFKSIVRRPSQRLLKKVIQLILTI